MSRRLIAAAAFLSLLPVVAQAKQLNPADVLLDASLPIQVIMGALLLATLAALVIGLMKLASGPRLAGGSAYLSALRLGGPLVGLLGAAAVVLMMFMALSNAPSPPPFRVLAPGIAEAVMLVLLGFLAGVVAVVMNWLVEARIDRAVLQV